MRGNKTLFSIFALFLLVALSASAYVIDGNAVTYEDAHVRVSVFPHTCRDPNLDCTFYANVTNKDNTTLSPNFAFVFPDELLDADLAEVVATMDSVDTANGTVEMLVSDLSAKVVADVEYNGSTAYSEPISLIAGQTKQYQWNAKLNPMYGAEGKFDVMLWTGDLNAPDWKFVLDPWWNATDTTYWYRFNNSLLDASGNGNDLSFGGTGNSHNSVYYKTNGYSVQSDGNGNIRRTAILSNFPSGNGNFTWMMWTWPTTLPSTSTVKKMYAMCENANPPTNNKAFKIGLQNISNQYVFIADIQSQTMNSSNLAGIVEYLQPVALAVTYNATNKEMKMYVNDQQVGNKTFATTPDWQFDVASFGDWYCGDGANRYAGLYDDARLYKNVLTTNELNMWYYNGAGIDILNLTNSNYPSILQNTYNVTSASDNGTIWRAATTIAVNTSDATPAVTFTTSLVGNCSIGRNDWNYTKMVSNDSTTRCGTLNETAMNCTLPETQQLSSGNQNIYISCIGENGESSVSTSGALSITLAINEEYIRSIMDAAINNALGNPTIFADQQIYVRRLNGSQQLATFDKVAVSGQQRWAFNYITGTEVFQYLGNLTPVLYSYETTNISTPQLQAEIEALISSTRN